MPVEPAVELEQEEPLDRTQSFLPLHRQVAEEAVEHRATSLVETVAQVVAVTVEHQQVEPELQTKDEMVAAVEVVTVEAVEAVVLPV